MLSNYCSRPFTDMHIEENGNITPCCVMPSNRWYMGNGIKDYYYGKPLKELQEKFLRNERPEECLYCWQAEEAGLKTHRRVANSKKSIYEIHIRLNNVCNFKCRICNPRFSSTWAAENKKHNYFPNFDWDTQKDVFDQDPSLLRFITDAIKKGDLRFLNISGGEPLLTNANYHLLNHLRENDATDIQICYSTNLSSLKYNNVDFLDLWKSFKSVRLEVSCDGWGRDVEYSRTGFDRKVFFTNLVKCLPHVAGINCVVSKYSVWTLPYLQKIADKLNLKVTYSPLFFPEFLNAQRLIAEDKDQLRKLYEPYPALMHLFDSYLNVDLPTMGKEFVKFNSLLDKHRNTNLFDVFPQYEKYKEL